MQIIVLHTVHYVSHNGITLSQFNPYVEATEENIKKLNKFITAGYLRIADEAEIEKEELIPEDIPKAANKELEDQKKEIEAIINNVKRGYSEEDLKDKTKTELIELLKIEGKPFKNTMKKEELISILVD